MLFKYIKFLKNNSESTERDLIFHRYFENVLFSNDLSWKFVFSSCFSKTVIIFKVSYFFEIYHLFISVSIFKRALKKIIPYIFLFFLNYRIFSSCFVFTKISYSILMQYFKIMLPNVEKNIENISEFFKVHWSFFNILWFFWKIIRSFSISKNVLFSNTFHKSFVFSSCFTKTFIISIFFEIYNLFIWVFIFKLAKKNHTIYIFLFFWKLSHVEENGKYFYIFQNPFVVFRKFENVFFFRKTVNQTFQKVYFPFLKIVVCVCAPKEFFQTFFNVSWVV